LMTDRSEALVLGQGSGSHSLPTPKVPAPGSFVRAASYTPALPASGSFQRSGSHVPPLAATPLQKGAELPPKPSSPSAGSLPPHSARGHAPAPRSSRETKSPPHRSPLPGQARAVAAALTAAGVGSTKSLSSPASGSRGVLLTSGCDATSGVCGTTPVASGTSSPRVPVPPVAVALKYRSGGC
jgi:hypothetical protein